LRKKNSSHWIKLSVMSQTKSIFFIKIILFCYFLKTKILKIDLIKTGFDLINPATKQIFDLINIYLTVVCMHNVLGGVEL